MTNDDKILKMLSNERRFTREKTISEVLEILDKLMPYQRLGDLGMIHYDDIHKAKERIKELKGK